MQHSLYAGTLQIFHLIYPLVYTHVCIYVRIYICRYTCPNVLSAETPRSVRWELVCVRTPVSTGMIYSLVAGTAVLDRRKRTEALLECPSRFTRPNGHGFVRVQSILQMR